MPTAWTRSLPDEPSVLLADGPRGTVVVGRETVSAFTTAGELRWRAEPGPLEPGGASAATRFCWRRPTTSSRSTGRRASCGGGPVRPRRRARSRSWRHPARPRWRSSRPRKGDWPGSTPRPAGRAGRPGSRATSAAIRWPTRLTGTVAAVWQEAGRTRLRVVDGASGVLRFEHPLGDWAGSPTVGRDVARRVVVVASGSGRFDGAVQAFDLTDGSPVWRARVGASFQPGLIPLIDGRMVVVVDQLGTVTALDLGSGRRRWRTRTGAALFESRPVAAAGAVLVPNQVGEVITLDRRSGALRARRRSAGFPIGLAPARGRVVMAQRLVRSHAVQAFRAARLAEPAGGPR